MTIYIPPTEDLPLGSVVLAAGTTGTAYQRFHSDAAYHGTNGKVLPTLQAVADTHRGEPLILLHRAPEED